MKVRLLYQFFIMILLVSCSGKPSESENITIATLKGPSSMGMIWLIDSLQKSGSNIKVVIADEPIQVRKMMIDGTADFAILPTTMAAILYNKGLNYRLAAIPVWGTLYLFGTDQSISHWSDLKGKRVNVMAKGMTPDVVFRYLLEQNGLNPDKDLTLDYRFPTHIDLANAMAAGQAKLAVISEPLVSLVMDKNKEVFPVFDLNHEWEKVLNIPFAQTSLLIKNSFAESNPQLVEQLINSYEYSTKWVNNNHDTAAKLIVEYNILQSFEVALSSIPRSNLKFVRSKYIKKDIEGFLRIFYNQNPDIIGGKIPDENFYF